MAVVTESPRMVMTWKGQTIADLSRAFLNTNGAVKHTSVTVPAAEPLAAAAAAHRFPHLREHGRQPEAAPPAGA